MRSEKDVRDNLNKALSEEAPDILSNILKSERFEDNLENDLRDEPLFNNEKENVKRWIPVGIVTCVIAILLVFSTINTTDLNNVSSQKLCTITVDVNPSLDIRIDEQGNVVKVIANNEDAKAIAQKANKKIDEKYSSKKVINYIAKQLVKKGYLKKKSSVMLISVAEEEKNSKERLDNVREILSGYKADSNNKFVTVYQEYENSKEVKELAKKKGMSNAKAAYCLKVSKKTDKKIDDICNESLDEVTSQVMHDEIDLGDKIDIEVDNDEDKKENNATEQEKPEGENTDEIIYVEDTSVVVENESSLEDEEKTAEIETMEETVYIEETITGVDVGPLVMSEEETLQEQTTHEYESVDESGNDNESENVTLHKEEVTSGEKVTEVVSEEIASEMHIQETTTGTDKAEKTVGDSENSFETTVHKEEKVIITETTKVQQ